MIKKVRIAYISSDGGVPVCGRTGCSIHAQEVLRAMAKRGAQVDLFAASLGGEPPPGLETVRSRPLPLAPKGDLAAREQFCLAANSDLRASLEKAGPFDLVYERYSLWSFAGMDYAQGAGTPGLLEVNAPLIEEQAEHRGLIDRAGAERVAEQAFVKAVALLAVSEEVAASLERFPGAHGKVRVVPDGVEPARFLGTVTAFRPTAPGTLTSGFVGTLKPWHGVEVLVEAFAKLHERSEERRVGKECRSRWSPYH